MIGHHRNLELDQVVHDGVAECGRAAVELDAPEPLADPEVGGDPEGVAVAGQVEKGGGRFFFVGERDVAKLGVEGDQTQVEGRLVVRVPRAATVWIRTGTADIVVRGLTGAVDIRTVAGDVDVRSRPQTFYGESMEGDLDLNIEAGIARARTGTGGIAFTGTVQDLTLSSVDGGLDVTASELRRGQFTTVAGAIVFAGGVRPAGSLIFETHSGDVTLALPSDLDVDSASPPSRAGSIRGTAFRPGPRPAPAAARRCSRPAPAGRRSRSGAIPGRSPSGLAPDRGRTERRSAGRLRALAPNAFVVV